MKRLTELDMLSMNYGELASRPDFEHYRKYAVKTDRCLLCGGNNVCSDGLCPFDFYALTGEEKKIANKYNRRGL